MRFRRREKERGAEGGGKTDRQDDGGGGGSAHFHCKAAGDVAAATAELGERDRRRHRDRRSGRRVERHPEQCAGRRAPAEDAAQAGVLDGELVHRGRADRGRQQDILSRGQSGGVRGKSSGPVHPGRWSIGQFEATKMSNFGVSSWNKNEYRKIYLCCSLVVYVLRCSY